MKGYQSKLKGNYNFPRIPPIPLIPWNRPGPFKTTAFQHESGKRMLTLVVKQSV